MRVQPTTEPKLSVRLESGSPINSSLYKINSQILKRAVDLEFRSQIGVDVVVRHTYPPLLDNAGISTSKLVVWQPWEFGGVPREWVQWMNNNCAAQFCYSDWLAACYKLSGLTIPIFQIPLGVDEVYTPRGEREDGPFRFLFIGGPVYRKGLSELAQAYYDAFEGNTDVELILKMQPEVYGAQVDISSWDGPKLTIIDDSLTEAGMAKLMQSVDCLVQPFRGEAWCMPIAEAAACGLPIIATHAGPAIQVLGAYEGWYKLGWLGFEDMNQHLPKSDFMTYLMTIDCSHLMQLMKSAFTAGPRLYTPLHWSWDDTARAFTDAIETIVRGESHGH